MRNQAVRLGDTIKVMITIIFLPVFPDPDWIRIPVGQWIRILILGGQTCPPNKDKMKKLLVFEELFVGLEASPRA
jgi:hypothetical protein